MIRFYTLFFFLTAAFLSNAQFLTGDTLRTIDSPKDHVLMDVDNDGDYDLVVIGFEEIFWHENEGDLVFGESNLILGGLSHVGFKDLYPADINADGFMDFVVNYNVGGSKIGWFENMEDGSFTEHIIWEGNFFRFECYDDDSDGDFDIFYIGELGDINRIAGNADGTFAAPVELDPGLVGTYYSYRNNFHSDVDNDGDEDLIFNVTHEVGFDLDIEIHYLENLGGTYASSVLLTGGFLQTPTVATFADMDGDGDEDAIFGLGYETYAVKYCENTGGAYELSEDFAYSSASDLAVGDLDLDGNMDIVGAFTRSQHQWIPGNGDGTFGEVINLPVEIWEETGWLSALTSVYLYDFDEDGDLEVYAETVQDGFYYMEYKNLTISDYKATGHFFADLNENGIWDLDEVGVDFPEINSDPVEEIKYVFEDGAYLVGFPIEDDITYTLSPELPEYWSISTPDLTYDVLIDGETAWEDLDFGIYPTELIDSIHTELVGWYPRCNDTIPYYVSIDNLGTTIVGGIVSVTLDDSISFVSSVIPPDSIVDQTIYWSYDDLSWFDDELIIMEVALPDFLSEGDDVVSYVTASVVEDGEEVFILEDSLVQTITCAFDPNDKTAFPTGEDELGFISVDEPYLEYTIRFQNTGTDTAFTVRITDALDANFDFESVQVLAESHDMEWSVDADGMIEFLFEDIALPDSNVNLIGSQGFVKYRVDFNDGLSAGNMVENNAQIFFDLNPPIVTNTTLHTLFDCETVLGNVELPEVVCYGEMITGTTEGYTVPSSSTYTWTLDEVSTVAETYTYESTGSGMIEIEVLATTDFCEASEIFTVEVAEEIEPETLPLIVLCPGDSALVFGGYLSEVGVYTDTIPAIETGCDSVLIQEIVLNDLEAVITPFESSEICVGHAPIALYGTPEGGTFSGEGVVGSTFDPTLAGEGEFMIYYTFEGDDGCSVWDTAEVMVAACLSVGEENGEKFEIYPNPMSDYATVMYGTNFHAGGAIRVTDLQGRLVRVYDDLTENMQRIDREELEKGVYLIELIDDQEMRLAVLRLVVE